MTEIEYKKIKEYNMLIINVVMSPSKRLILSLSKIFNNLALIYYKRSMWMELSSFRKKNTSQKKSTFEDYSPTIFESLTWILKLSGQTQIKNNNKSHITSKRGCVGSPKIFFTLFLIFLHGGIKGYFCILESINTAWVKCWYFHRRAWFIKDIFLILVKARFWWKLRI